MRLYNIYGKLSNKSVGRYRIDWDGKSRSKAQFKVKQFLKKYWSTHVVFEEFPVYGSKMHVDILNATLKVAIEVNGAQHDKFVPFFHKNSRSNYLRSIKRDHKKYNWLEKNEFKVVEILDTEADKLSKSFFEDKFDVIL
tara:strand:- start:525 stop:941 length:417 start_codon:yes stop_codon:yes gene_type:complete